MLLSTIMFNHYYSYTVLNKHILSDNYINYTTIERRIGIPQLNTMWILRFTQQCIQHCFKLKTAKFLSVSAVFVNNSPVILLITYVACITMC